MENELNDLQAEVIITNLYPVTKYGRTFYNENFYGSNLNINKYNTTSKKNSSQKRVYGLNKSQNSNRMANSMNNINMHCILGYKENDVKHSFLDNYDEVIK